MRAQNSPKWVWCLRRKKKQGNSGGVYTVQSRRKTTGMTGLRAFKLFKKHVPPFFRRLLHHDEPKPSVQETMKKISRFVIDNKIVSVFLGGVNRRQKNVADLYD